jgi:hypothetical protein
LIIISKLKKRIQDPKTNILLTRNEHSRIVPVPASQSPLPASATSQRCPASNRNQSKIINSLKKAFKLIGTVTKIETKWRRFGDLFISEL